MNPRLANILYVLAFATALGWDGARLIAAVLHRNWPIAGLTVAAALLLGAVIHHLLTKAPYSDASQRTEP